MTLKQMYAQHQELWFWLADNPKKWKSSWPEWKRSAEDAYSLCFACQWVLDRQGRDWLAEGDCKQCPLDWPNGFCSPGVRTGLYDAYCDSMPGSAHRTVMADLIANVPLKKGLK